MHTIRAINNRSFTHHVAGNAPGDATLRQLNSNTLERLDNATQDQNQVMPTREHALLLEKLALANRINTNKRNLDKLRHHLPAA